MGLNKSGNTTVLVILMALAFFMFGMIFMDFLLDEVTRSRNSDNLNCASPSTDGGKILCLVVDGVIPLVIGGILTIAIGFILGRFIK